MAKVRKRSARELGRDGQGDLFDALVPTEVYDRDKVLQRVQRLVACFKSGLLGGDLMPEDQNPGLGPSSKENFLYFTLPMALNYQRDSYALWRAARKTYEDESTRFVFSPRMALLQGREDVKNALQRHKVALQPNKHTDTWIRLSETFEKHFAGDVRQLFIAAHWRVDEIKKIVQMDLKKEFPYLSGEKICNYWLYVIEQYADATYRGREHITVAPDTHVMQASLRLGLAIDDAGPNDVRVIVSKAWRELLTGTDLLPIDVHTPLWLWSRAGFPLRDEIMSGGPGGPHIRGQRI